MIRMRSALALVILAIFWVSAGWLFKKIPTGFLPDEDQGAFFVSVRLPDGASLDRTDAATAKVENVVAHLKGIDHYFVFGGLDIATQTSGSNVSTVIVTLKPWDQRKSKELQLDAILADARRGFSQIPEAFSFAFGLPPILGLSLTGGFQFMLEDHAVRHSYHHMARIKRALSQKAPGGFDDGANEESRHAKRER